MQQLKPEQGNGRSFENGRLGHLGNKKSGNKNETATFLVIQYGGSIPEEKPYHSKVHY